MKRICKLFALLLALTLVLTACGGNAATDGDPTDSNTANGNSAAEPMMDLGSGLSLMSVNRYAGAFVEDGTDETVADVLAITVRNDGDKTVQYAHITLDQGESTYEFNVTTLPVGASAQVLEVSRQAMPDSTEGMAGQVDTFAVFDTEPSLYEDVLGIETQDTAITITNKSGSDITGPLYVYYKIAYGDLYLGGITYRVGVADGLKAGESSTCYAGHFSNDYSKLMFATYVQ